MTQSNDNSAKRNVPLTPFKPPFGLSNPHLQTVLSSKGPRKVNRDRRFKPYVGSQKRVLLDGGEGIRLEGYHNQVVATADPAAEPQAEELIIMIHGWEGSHESTYMKSMAATVLNAGFDTFRLNMRDHGDSHHLNKGVFNSTLIEEVIHSIADLQKRLNYKRYSLVGFSLGGNFCLRVAANAHGRPINLQQVIAFCPVIHAQQSNDVLNQTRNAFYGKYFVRKWRRSLQKKLDCWPEYEFGEQLVKLKTLDQMNDAFIPKYTEFSVIEDYFDAYAIAGDKMSKTICPCYLHFAKDDMIIPVDGVHLLADNPDLHVTITEHGGHCGYLSNWRGDSWQDHRALEIIQAALV